MNTAALGQLRTRRRPQAEAHASPAEYLTTEEGPSQKALAGTSALRVSACSCANAAFNVAAMRATLLVGSVLIAAVMWLAVSGRGQVDVELALLLRGMAAIKGVLSVAAAGLVWWRLGQLVSLRVAAAYIACVWAFFAATALIWQLAFMLEAAALFHVAGLFGLIVSLREDRPTLRFGRQRLKLSLSEQQKAR